MTRRATRILTVTPNPSLDLLFEHDHLVWDDANRMDDPRRRPGGQGINVARAARVLGADAIAVCLLGGRTGEQIAQRLEREGTPLDAVRVEHETRLFVAVREQSSGRSLLLNARGPAHDAETAAALEQLTAARIAAESPNWIASCGSVPTGFPVDFHARIARHARAAGIRFVPDCDGPALRLAVDVGCDLIVPNQHEAARLVGHAVRDVESAASTARSLQRAAATYVAVTLGPDGAVLACPGGCWHARPPALDQGSAVGAGDAFLAALMLSLDSLDPPQALARAVATGTATLLARGTSLIHRDDVERLIERVNVARID